VGAREWVDTHSQWTWTGDSPASGAKAASFGPQRVVFSVTITAVRTTIHHRLAAPVANITSINAQPHPKQDMPWRTPSHHAATTPRR
jgi:hypothetical protein